MTPQRVITIGVYGFTAETFFSALTSAEVDLFCDLRARRGLRGPDYAFANSKRLQARLVEFGIDYQHFPELAPTAEIRSLQHRADSHIGVAKRGRSELDERFVLAYRSLLAEPAAVAALEQITEAAAAPALFCVERLPTACHRSLVAERLARDGIPIEHLVP